MLMFTKMWADGLARVADELQVVGMVTHNFFRKLTTA